MDIYVLDSLFRRIQVIDNHISFIWTERYNSLGDFEIRVRSTIETRSLLAIGTYLGLDRTMRVMVVETVERTITDEDGPILIAKGRSLEAIFTKRVAWADWTRKPPASGWVYEDAPESIAVFAVRATCRDFPLFPADVIPNLDITEEVGDYNVAAFQDDIVYATDTAKTVFDVVSEIAKNFDLGFSLTRKEDTGRLWFRMFNGVDRTTVQDQYPKILFSNDFESLESTTQFASNADEYNVAYVFTPVGNRVVAPAMVDPDIAGWDRKVLPVYADDITDTDPVVAANKMDVRGRQELLKHQSVRAFDGQIRKDNPWVYGQDYNMGDMVEMRDEDGFTNRVRVTEQIFSSDRNGDNAYPTLSVRTLAIPGSWLLWNVGKVWADLTTEEWSEL